MPVADPYQPVKPNAPAVADVTANQGAVDSRSTVAGQMNGLLKQDSAYMQNAIQSGNRQAASRGLLNSSLGAGMAMGAATAAALPMAQQDAQTYQTNQRDNEARTFAANQLNAGARNTANLQVHQNDANLYNQSTLASQGFGHQQIINQQISDLQKLQDTWRLGQQKELNTQNFGFQTQLANQGFGHQTSLNTQQNQAELARQLAAHQQQLAQNQQGFGFNTQLNAQQNAAALARDKQGFGFQTQLNSQQNAAALAEQKAGFGFQTQLNSQQNQFALTQDQARYQQTLGINQQGFGHQQALNTQQNQFATAQDYARYQQQLGLNTTQNQFALTQDNARWQQQTALNAQQNQAALTQDAARFGQQTQLNAQTQGGEMALQTLRGKQSADLAYIEAQYKQLLQTSASAQEAWKSYNDQLGAIVSKENLTGSHVQNAITVQKDSLESYLGLLGAISGIDLRAYANSLPTVSGGGGTAGVFTPNVNPTPPPPKPSGGAPAAPAPVTGPTTPPGGSVSPPAPALVPPPAPPAPAPAPVVTPPRRPISDNRSCFLAGSMVSMADGSRWPIERIGLGEEVQTATGTGTVVGLHRPKLGERPLFAMSDGGCITSAEHGLWSMAPDGRQWWATRDLEQWRREVEDGMSSDFGGHEPFDLTDKEGRAWMFATEDGWQYSRWVRLQAKPETQLYHLVLDQGGSYFVDGYLVDATHAGDTISWEGFKWNGLPEHQVPFLERIKGAARTFFAQAVL